MQNRYLFLVAAILLTGSSSSTSFAFDGSIAWSRAQVGAASGFSPVVANDGSIYTSNGGAVTAYAPDGTQLWNVNVNGGVGPVSLGNDGTIYASVGVPGANPEIIALNPDGSEKWTFDAGANIHAGPNVGPDGNIYAVADTQFGGIGFFVIDPDANLLCSNTGEPTLSADTGQPHEIVFSQNRAFVSMATQGSGSNNPPVLWAFDFSANQVFELDGSCQGQPVVDPLTGNLVTGNGNCQRIESYDAENGNLIWGRDAPSQSPCDGLANIAIGPDGSIYTAFCYRAFWSLTSSGDQRWFDDDFGFYFQMNHLSVVPNNSALLDLGGKVGQPGWVRAFSTEDGSLQWQVDLEFSGQRATSRPAFDSSNRRMYFNVQRFGTDISELFAVDLFLPGDVNGDGAVNLLDVGPFVSTIADGDYVAAADINGDGVVDLLDVDGFIQLLGN